MMGKPQIPFEGEEWASSRRGPKYGDAAAKTRRWAGILTSPAEITMSHNFPPRRRLLMVDTKQLA